MAKHLTSETFGPVQLAQRLGLSERTLYRRLSKLADLKPAAPQRELGLNQAQYLVAAGRFNSMTEVPDVAGFASANCFSACYAARLSLRPSDYLVSRS